MRKPLGAAASPAERCLFESVSVSVICGTQLLSVQGIAYRITLTSTACEGPRPHVFDAIIFYTGTAFLLLQLSQIAVEC